jgi:hypothetical protein
MGAYLASPMAQMPTTQIKKKKKKLNPSFHLTDFNNIGGKLVYY